jgi:hypothetical protein
LKPQILVTSTRLIFTHWVLEMFKLKLKSHSTLLDLRMIFEKTYKHLL